MGKVAKLFRFWLYSFIFVSILGLLWYNWPQERGDAYALLPADALGYGVVMINWQEEGPHQFFELFWQKLIQNNQQLDFSFVKKTLLALLPRQVVFGVRYDCHYAEKRKKPEVYVFIPLGKKMRLVQLARKITQWQGRGAGVWRNWDFRNDILVYAMQGNSWPVVSPEQKTLLRSVFREEQKKHIHLYLSNKEKKLSEFVRLLEEKNSFSFFPTIDSVEHLEVRGFLVNAVTLRGKITFVSRYIAEVDTVALDTLFLSNVLMRLLLGAGYEYEGNVNTIANYAELDFSIRGLNKLWEQVQ